MSTEEVLQKEAPKALSNSLVEFTATMKPQCILECSVKGSKELKEKAYTEAVKRISKLVTIPGFRKGKAPQSHVLQSYKKQIEEETKTLAMRIGALECIELGKLPAIDKERISNLSKDPDIRLRLLSFGDDFLEFTVAFEVAPLIPQIEPEKFTLKEEARRPVGEKEVAERIRQALFFLAEWVPVTDRPTQEGDFVLLDVKLEADESSVFENTRFEITDQSMAKWMKEAILGKNIGDIINATSVADDDLPTEEKEFFQPKNVLIRINLIETPVLPELTTELLQKMGVGSKEEFHSQIEKMLNEEADRHVKEAHMDQVMNFLIEAYPFDLPESLVVQEARFRFQKLAEDPDFMNDWNSASDAEKKKIAGVVTSQSAKAMRLFYLCQKFLEDKKIPLLEDSESSNKESGSISHLAIQKASEYIIAHASNAKKS